MLLFRCEYLQIISFIEARMPHFLDKYPGYKMILFKLHYFGMIIQEKPLDDIYNFFNKELFPLLRKYNNGIDEDYYDFKSIIENPKIIQTRQYQQMWEKACNILCSGLSLALDWILWVENAKNKNSLEVINYYKEKENFVKEVNFLINLEKEIVNNYQINESNKYHNLHLSEFEPDNNMTLFNNEFEFNDVDDKPFDNFIFPPRNSDENINQILSNNKPLKDDVNHVIFENKNELINYNFYNDLNNNLKNNNLNLINFTNDENNKNKTIINLNNEENNKNNNNTESISLNTNSIGTKKNSKITINSRGSVKSYKSDLRKKKIKEYKFRQLKRENVDKKILRKFKKFLKIKSKEKGNNEIKSFIKSNEFWPEYIKLNLMPPFNYDKENISFKSFNTQYLCWFFEHKFSLELFNIFVRDNYDSLLTMIKEAYTLSENSDDYSLLKNYINTMPLIYGKESENRSTAYCSNAKPSDDDINEVNGVSEIINDGINLEKDKNNNYDCNNEANKNYDDMIIEEDVINSNENEDFNNINNIDINNNMLNINPFNNMNNMNNINNINNDFSNPQTFLYGRDLDPNINENDVNNSNLNNSFEENSNNKKFDHYLFKFI